MAFKNRTEAKAVVTAWAPILDLEATHKPDLRDEILDNCLFRKDVSDTQLASGTTKTLDFSGFDYIEVSQSNNVAYTLNNILQGEIKYLKITKTAAQTITFANAEDISIRKSFINSTTEVIYRVTNKDSDLYVESINIDNDVSGNTITSVAELGDWDMDTDLNPDVIPTNPAGDKDKVRSVSVIIRSDSGALTTNLPLNTVDANTAKAEGGIGLISDVAILIFRLLNGTFDSVNYNAKGGYNRGWITVTYEP